MPDDANKASGPLKSLQFTDGKLASGEEWWRDHQEWLAQQGYMLRSRYRPGWVPSWKATPKLAKHELDAEDRALLRVRVPHHSV